jgi:hypothetical protein
VDVTILSFCNYKLYHVTDVLFINLVKFSYYFRKKNRELYFFLLSHERNWKCFVWGRYDDDLNNKFIFSMRGEGIDGEKEKFMSRSPESLF